MSEAEEEQLRQRSRDWGGRSQGPEGRLSTNRVRVVRAGVAGVLAVIDVGALVMAIADVHGPARFAFGLILGVVVPGWSLVGLLRLGNPALEISLALGVGLAVMMLLAQILLTVHEWHLVAFEEVIAVLCLPSLVWQAKPRSNRRGISRGQRD